ncbi:hypothetical protein CXG81DRAFT_23786 [Caulochytrium protostelioides]|uniref:Uncharacterized protein n=1 Tax=Caulochytrium protostelioides TaxID=1555241 RepID=A0A4P9XEE3_9FUNG|nr:hypothetical protein CXG81DRAFT_23786 [Caulochytrium protostelioides]|eukprot:RKP03521.1 hypothetical protein CXG81DRAFT_23786 [Caulochytrium protostelioides]
MADARPTSVQHGPFAAITEAALRSGDLSVQRAAAALDVPHAPVASVRQAVTITLTRTVKPQTVTRTHPPVTNTASPSPPPPPPPPSSSPPSPQTSSEKPSPEPTRESITRTTSPSTTAAATSWSTTEPPPEPSSSSSSSSSWTEPSTSEWHEPTSTNAPPSTTEEPATSWSSTTTDSSSETQAPSDTKSAPDTTTTTTDAPWIEPTEAPSSASASTSTSASASRTRTPPVGTLHPLPPSATPTQVVNGGSSMSLWNQFRSSKYVLPAAIGGGVLVLIVLFLLAWTYRRHSIKRERQSHNAFHDPWNAQRRSSRGSGGSGSSGGRAFAHNNPFQQDPHPTSPSRPMITARDARSLGQPRGPYGGAYPSGGTYPGGAPFDTIGRSPPRPTAPKPDRSVHNAPTIHSNSRRPAAAAAAAYTPTDVDVTSVPFREKYQSLWMNSEIHSSSTESQPSLTRPRRGGGAAADELPTLKSVHAHHAPAPTLARGGPSMRRGDAPSAGYPETIRHGEGGRPPSEAEPWQWNASAGSLPRRQEAGADRDLTLRHGQTQRSSRRAPGDAATLRVPSYGPDAGPWAARPAAEQDDIALRLSRRDSLYSRDRSIIRSSLGQTDSSGSQLRMDVNDIIGAYESDRDLSLPRDAADGRGRRAPATAAVAAAPSPVTPTSMPMKPVHPSRARHSIESDDSSRRDSDARFDAPDTRPRDDVYPARRSGSREPLPVEASRWSGLQAASESPSTRPSDEYFPAAEQAPSPMPPHATTTSAVSRHRYASDPDSSDDPAYDPRSDRERARDVAAAAAAPREDPDRVHGHSPSLVCEAAPTDFIRPQTLFDDDFDATDLQNPMHPYNQAASESESAVGSTDDSSLIDRPILRPEDSVSEVAMAPPRAGMYEEPMRMARQNGMHATRQQGMMRTEDTMRQRATNPFDALHEFL